MGRRKSVYRVRREWAETLPSPNATVPQITVELRVFYPPHMDNEIRAAELVAQLSNEVMYELTVRPDCACGDDDHEAYL